MNLHEANQRLYALRAEFSDQWAVDSDQNASVPQTPPSVSISNAIVHLPDHLGWDSDPLTRHLRAKFKNEEREVANREVGSREWSVENASIIDPLTTVHCPLITLSPTLALTLLKSERVADGRLWLILRALDKTGRGWHERDTITAELTDPERPFYLCGKRQLRKLLAHGEGLFWQREKGRVWLRRPSRIIHALGGEWVRGRAVELPTAVLCQPIGDVRAHLYAIFHSGRGESAGPISRATLTDLTGASARTQQAYEIRARVQVEANLALGESVTALDPQEAAWRDGRAGFVYTDHAGQHGVAGGQYYARRLPNRYIGPHPRRGRPRRLQHELALLSEQGRTGNGRWVGKLACRYGRDGKQAGRLWEKGETAVCWPSGKKRGGVQVWYALPAD